MISRSIAMHAASLRIVLIVSLIKGLKEFCAVFRFDENAHLISTASYNGRFREGLINLRSKFGVCLISRVTRWAENSLYAYINQ